MTKLPPGQRELGEFPRFGLSQFVRRFPTDTHHVSLKITGDIDESVTVSDDLRDLPRVDQTSDFHCVTTWTRRSLRWSGFRFSDFYERIVVPRPRSGLVAPGHYGYKNPKHVSAVEFWCDDRQYRPSAPFRFMDHPRARVALEERGRGVPGWLLRYLYRPLVRPTIYQFRRALEQHLRARSRIEWP